MDLQNTNKIYYKAETSGIDCLDLCRSKQHFLNYNKAINYNYNSKGFRDMEWPDNFEDVVWCVGDSFTVGLGQPFEETWPSVLQSTINKRCLNLGIDGCSNDSMSMMIEKISELYQPTNIVVMWSYVSRRLVGNENIQYDPKHFGDQEDIQNFISNFKKVYALNCNIVHLSIPGAFWSQQMEFVINKITNNQIHHVRRLDYARDHHHFDIKTSQAVCSHIAKELEGLQQV